MILTSKELDETKERCEKEKLGGISALLRIEKTIPDLLETIQEMRECLEFYAKSEHYTMTIEQGEEMVKSELYSNKPLSHWDLIKILKDEGQKARDLLRRME